MGKNLLILSLLFLSLSCGKDTFQSKPQLTIKSVSTVAVEPLEGLQVIMRLTDKEGDFYDSIWVEKITTRCPGSNWRDSGRFSIPGSTPRKKNFDGEVVISFNYALDLQPKCIRQDTAVFSFWMKDAAGNRSDTARTPPIIIKKP